MKLLKTKSSGPDANIIYADFNASAPLCQDVVEQLVERIQKGPFANPNASHSLGLQVSTAMEDCRKTCATALGAAAQQVIFNSGSSEGITTVFRSLLEGGPQQERDLIVISSIEHSAVSEAAQYFKKQGFRLEVIPVNSQGQIEMVQFENLIDREKRKVALVSIMAANNETGVLQPYQKIGALCGQYQIPFFSDTTQLIGKDEFSFNEAPIDYAVVAGHKVGAFTGVGLLLVKNKSTIKPLIFGGGQEGGLRGGTQNYIGIESLAIALQRFQKNKANLKVAKEYRDVFERQLQTCFPQLVIFGQSAPRVGTTTFLAHPGFAGHQIQKSLEKDGIYVTTSSACSDSAASSRVLSAMGVEQKLAIGATRISLCCHPGSKYNTELGPYQKIFDSLKNIFSQTN